MPNHDVGKEELIKEFNEAGDPRQQDKIINFMINRERSKDARIAELEARIGEMVKVLKATQRNNYNIAQAEQVIDAHDKAISIGERK